jgi:hypothetical protein
VRPAAPAPFIFLLLSLTLAMPASAQNWKRVSVADRYTAVYLDMDSVRVLDGGIRVAVSVINYQTANGNEESLLAGTLYDCLGSRKRDQFVRQSDAHWGKGIEILISGEESKWFEVLGRSMGDSLQRAVCSSD